MTLKDKIAGVFGLATFAVFGFAVYVWFAVPSKPTADRAASAAPELTGEACRADAACWTRKHISRARLACWPRIEAAAPYGHRWTDSTFEPRFAGAAEIDRDMLSYHGAAIEVRTAVGAWTRARYACLFDTATGHVVRVNLTPIRG